MERMAKSLLPLDLDLSDCTHAPNPRCWRCAQHLRHLVENGKVRQVCAIEISVAPGFWLLIQLLSQNSWRISHSTAPDPALLGRFGCGHNKERSEEESDRRRRVSWPSGLARW